MKRRMTHMLALLLAVFICVPAVPVFVLAEPSESESSQAETVTEGQENDREGETGQEAGENGERGRPGGPSGRYPLCHGGKLAAESFCGSGRGDSDGCPDGNRAL